VAKRSSDRASSPVWGLRWDEIKRDYLRAQAKSIIYIIVEDIVYLRRRSNCRAIAPIAAQEDDPQVDRTCARRTATIAIIRRSRNVKLFELHDVWRAEEIAIDDGITPVARFFVAQVDPPSRSLFVTQSLDASRSKLVTKGKEKKTKHHLSRRAVDSDLSRRVDELIVVFVLLPRVPESHRSSSTLDLRLEAHLPSLFPFSVVQTLVAFRSAPICFVLEIVLLKILLTKLTKVRAV